MVTHDHGDSPNGCNWSRVGSAAPPSLAIRTGYLEDPRKLLTDTDPFYGWALHAWRYQDHWPYNMWVSFWTVALPLWPHPEGAQREIAYERLERISGRLRRDGFTWEAIAEAVGVSTKTLRDAGVNQGAHEFMTGTGRYRLLGPASPGSERFVQRLVAADGTFTDWPLKAVACLPRVYDPEAGEDVQPPTGAAWGVLQMSREAAGAWPLPVRGLNVAVERSPVSGRMVLTRRN